MSKKKKKKALYNKNYREKLRLQKEEQKNKEKETEDTESLQESVEETMENNEVLVEQTENTQKDEITMTKATYDYLISLARDKEPQSAPVVAEPKPETKNETSTEPSFFFLVKQQFKGMAASVIPILTIQGVILGTQYLMKSSKQYNSNASNRTSTEPNQSRFNSPQEFAFHSNQVP